MALKHRIRWLALHGVVRASSRMLARRGDPQGRLISDLELRRNPVPFIDELRVTGPIVKCRLMHITVDHKIANEVLRSDDFRVIAMGTSMPEPLQWVIRHTDPGLLHPVEPPSMLWARAVFVQCRLVFRENCAPEATVWRGGIGTTQSLRGNSSSPIRFRLNLAHACTVRATWRVIGDMDSWNSSVASIIRSSYVASALSSAK